ncbi:MAG TPA: ABC transporter substrate-binding protein [Xanthobacteraceae bacterium]
MNRHGHAGARTLRLMLQGSAVAAALLPSLPFSVLPALAQKACPAEIGIGVIAPVTGSKAEQGQQFTEGAKVAIDEINAAGGINGSKLQLQILDDEGQPNEAVAAAQRLASNTDVYAVIGPSSTASSSAAIPVLKRAKLVAISPSASTPSLVTKNTHFYIMSLDLGTYGPLVPKYAVDRFGAHNFAIIHVKDDWGEAVTKVEKEWAAGKSIPIVADAVYTQGDRDFKAQLTVVLEKKPEALVLNTHYTEGALIVRQARQLGYTGPIVGQGTIVYPQFIELAGSSADGVVSWTDFLSTLESQPVAQADQKFKKATGKEPLQYHISTYDAVMILKKAFQAVGCDRDKLTTEVAGTKDFPGIVGKISFNAERLPEKKIFWVEVKNGKWALAPGD